eukprot:CAMPEP_0172420898 /NCGR_PEP_ID=MMETSP1064-20121228/7207_1 /TAXON_ID=202472 /ORGANISM="Aulacoseira subarctica , Strain CCAP 1002/5" /LENGTH=455 /DNA_ID=CAMNT_0013161041 /DNA_START=151 /DNA_END=1518 /DNA_ORIENTATION=-
MSTRRIFSTIPRIASSSQKKASGVIPIRVGTSINNIVELQKRTSNRQSPSEVLYTGDAKLPITSSLALVLPKTPPPYPFPVFRIVDEDGVVRKEVDAQEVLSQNALYTDPALLQRALVIITRLRQMDDLLLNAQRQGRISFYMSCRGEEAIHVGAASALDKSDPILAQYREQGLLMWRGFTLEQFTNQCFSNDLDLGKGRQMPVHYGSRALNYHTISSPLGTQIPQAVGVAYKLKLDKDNKNCAVTFFGDGAASTGDFHSACNFAATLECPIIFFCRNNGYAISTSIVDQYRGDGIIGRAPGYGIAAIRVDGNDLLAVHSATKLARDYAIQRNQPVMIEAMTYRQGHHSTSDDSSRYRSKEEVQRWTNENDPLTRLLNFIQQQGNERAFAEHTKISDEERMAVRKAMEKAEGRAKPSLSTLFEDVYSQVPPLLQRQEAEHLKHIQKFPEFYQNRH